jgi:hypothetical protein
VIGCGMNSLLIGKKENNVDILKKQELMKLNLLLSMSEEEEELEKEKKKQLEKKEYENNIDPIWYLKNGPKIIFPTEMIPSLTIQDYVEYYRCYPTLRWSLYPTLLKEIKENLTKDEKKKLVQFENYQKEKRSDRLVPSADWMKDAKSTFLYLKKFFNLSIFRYIWIFIQFLLN